MFGYSSDLLFRIFFLRTFRISSFSSRHRRQFLDAVLRVGICLTMSHIIVYLRLLSFRLQTYFDSSVLFRYFLLLRDLQWFDVCLCLLVVSDCYTSFVEDADLQAVAFDRALLRVSAVTWSAVVRVVCSVLCCCAF